MNYKQIPVIGTNCYLVWDEFTKNAVCIDPGFAGRKIAIEIQKFSLKLKSIFLFSVSDYQSIYFLGLRFGFLQAKRFGNKRK